MAIHETYMQRCIQLARLGAGSTAPNPMVGAVLVYDDRIIGEGWHQQYGGPHAEVHCLQNVAEADRSLIEKSTLYVCLEPCAHFGKTPPCADLIVQYRIPKVVIGCTDTFSEVNGRGIEILKSAGIEVVFPVLEQECKDLNRIFFTFHRQKRPYVVLKWAQTEDGFIAPKATGNYAISSPESQVVVHKWRSEFSAIAVGFNTVVLDNPRLNNRLWPNGGQPVRVILDPKNELPCDRNVFDGEQLTFIYNAHFSLDGEMTQWIKVPEQHFLQQVLHDLYLKNITSILVEGGAQTHSQFIKEGLYDAIYVITSHNSLGDGIAAPLVPSSAVCKEEHIATDTIHYYYY